MKKIKSLFVREFDEGHRVNITPEVTKGYEWVLRGEGVATRKWDGTCTLIENGEISRRYDCKKGKTPPEGFVPADEPDPITGHWPGWVKIDKYNPKGDEKFYVEAYINTFGSIDAVPENGTYELCGPKFLGNPEKLEKHIFIKHGNLILEDVPRTFEGIRNYLQNHYIEGIVFHRNDGSGDMCKIKRVDFGFEWNGKTSKRGCCNMRMVNEYAEAMNLKSWKKTTKKKYSVYVCMPKLGTKVYNHLEDVWYETSEKKPFVLSGTAGEQWVIDPAKLFKTYQLPTGNILDLEYLKTKGHPYKVDWFKIETKADGVVNWALFVPKSVKLGVPTSWGDVLTANRSGVPHGMGDYLVCVDNCGMPNLSDMWVVNGEIFPKTYDMRAFPGKSLNVVGEPPIPKSIL